MENKNYGFIKPQIDKSHYILGQRKLPMNVVLDDGDWSKFIPQGEEQFIPEFDTYNCTGFGSTNQIEMYMKAVFGLDVNYSDRWVGIISGTKPPGNDPHTVYEAIRKYGLIPENMLPLTEDIKNIDEYFSFKGADEKACYEEGRKWLAQYDFQHEWVFNPDQPQNERENNMKVALQFSPLASAVYAWQKDDRGIYIALSQPNHWTSQYAYINYKNIFDSYDPFEKEVDQNIQFCKRISIVKKNIENPKLNWLQRLISFLFEINIFKIKWQ